MRKHRLDVHGFVVCTCGRKFAKEEYKEQHRRQNWIHRQNLTTGSVASLVSSINLSTSKDLYDLRPKDLGSFITSNIQADALFLGCCGKVIDQLVTCLQQATGNLCPRRILKAGSLGKGTAVNGRSDIDLVMMLNDFSSVSTLMTNMPSVLSDLREFVETNTRARPQNPTRFSVPAVVVCDSGHEHDVDILPAVDLIGLGKKPKQIYKLMGESSDLIHEFSVSLAPLQLKVIKDLPTKVKSLITLIKYWKDEKLKGPGEPEMSSFAERGVGDPKWPSSYALELVVMHQWIKAGRRKQFDMTSLLKAVLQSLSDHQNMEITFPGTMTYGAERVAGKRSPYIMDPANPYNDMYHGLVDGRSFDWNLVASEAQTWLTKPLFC